MSRRAWLVVAAAGRGERLGAGVPKALVPLGGLPLLCYSLEAASASGAVEGAVVVGDREAIQPALGSLFRAARSMVRAVVAGGPARRDSVRNGLARVREAVGENADPVVLIHDAARPFAPPDLFARVAEAATSCGATCARPSPDTVKAVAGDRVVRTLARETLVLVQTPQGGRLSLFERAHAAWHGGEASDDALLIEALGEPVAVVPGSPYNFKITTPEDLALAEALVASRALSWLPDEGS